MSCSKCEIWDYNAPNIIKFTMSNLNYLKTILKVYVIICFYEDSCIAPVLMQDSDFESCIFVYKFPGDKPSFELLVKAFAFKMTYIKFNLIQDSDLEFCIFLNIFQGDIHFFELLVKTFNFTMSDIKCYLMQDSRLQSCILLYIFQSDKPSSEYLVKTITFKIAYIKSDKMQDSDLESCNFVNTFQADDYFFEYLLKTVPFKIALYVVLCLDVDTSHTKLQSMNLIFYHDGFLSTFVSVLVTVDTPNIFLFISFFPYCTYNLFRFYLTLCLFYYHNFLNMATIYTICTTVLSIFCND